MRVCGSITGTLLYLAVVYDERVAEGEQKEDAAQEQPADCDAEVAAAHVTQHARDGRRRKKMAVWSGWAGGCRVQVAYRMAVARNDSKEESAAAALVTARSRHTNAPATPMPCATQRHALNPQPFKPGP